MDKNKQASYDEVHAKLVEAMQKASCSDETGPYKTPSVDLSFLEEDSETESKRRKFSFGRFGKVAAILIIALLSINVLMIATNSMTSYGEKGLLHRIQVGINGIFTDEEEETMSDDVVESIVVSDVSNLKLAKEFLPSIYIPKYVPAGYEFQSLKVEKYLSGDCLGTFEYISENSAVLQIVFYSADDSNVGVFTTEDKEIIKTDDRIIRIYDNVNQKGYVADVYTEEYCISIKSVCEKEELLKIAKSLN